MRNITNANLISIDSGFGFAANTEAGMGDVRCCVDSHAALHLRLYSKRSLQASPAARAGKRVAKLGERRAVLGCGMPSTSPCRGRITSPSRQCLRQSWRLQRVAYVGPAVSPASSGIS